MLKETKSKFLEFVDTLLGMKILLAVLCLSCSFLEAAFVDNFSKPSTINEGLFIPDRSLINFRGGVVSDYLAKKKLKPNGSKDKARSFWIRTFGAMGSFTMNIREWFDATGYLGMGNTSVHFTFNGTPYLGKDHNQLFWTVGGKLIIFERKGLCFGVDGKLLGISSSIAFPEPKAPNHFSLFEWQVAAGLSQQFSFFTPYMGVTFTNSKVHLKPFPLLHKGLLKLQQKDLIGLVLGFTLSSGSYLSFDVEGRFINETGVFGSFEVRF